jgi:hypothetical protein
MKIRLATGGCLLLLLQNSIAGTGAIAALVPAGTELKAEAPKPLYRQFLDALKKSDAVIPMAPEVHPVAAVYNREAIIPPQCYTRTEGKHNPCYVCHQNQVPERENTMNDGGLQAAYSFSDLGMTNHWNNLFEDRSKHVASIGDQEILQWIAQDNYSELAPRLQTASFKGWIPDLDNLQQAADAFDEQGFAKDGSHWVAFNYKPFPSTFWPTNGSTDDVMIRLPESFRTDKQGHYSHDIYKANLAILEANIKGFTSISSLPIDEKVLGRDLNRDGKLNVAEQINDVSRYVGAAEAEFIDTYLYPEHTEFLHTVRYLGIAADGAIRPSTRIKEVRYMRKWKAYRKPVYARHYDLEAFEKEAGNLPGYQNLGHYGLDNGMGWAIYGFIEDRKGRLRAGTFEENLFCMGCHNSIGATIDKTFSFARKVDGAKGWRYIDLAGMQDVPNKGESKGEILTYFERVGGGDEFRSNPEMVERWFKPDGSVNAEKVRAARDVYELITPSRERALLLNKAYRVVVADQDYIFGRDATPIPPKNVYEQVDNETSPSLPPSLTYRWDIRLDWGVLHYGQQTAGTATD